MAHTFFEKNKYVLKNVKTFKERVKDDCECWKTAPIQQSDYLKDFLECIRQKGLEETYCKYGDNPPPPAASKAKKQEADNDVIIVGAGMSGIVAAYELKRAGLKVKILEETARYGGRVFTYSHPYRGLARGIYAEAGAMRLPGKLDDPNDRPHFLTDGYITDFGLPIQVFSNYDPNGLSYIYGLKEKTTDWADKYFDEVWPDWRQGIKPGAGKVNDIEHYYELTTEIVTNQLRNWLFECKTIPDEIDAWNRWINIWSQFTFESFLESNVDVIKAKVDKQDRRHLDLVALENLLPWSNDALRGYSVFSYTEQLDQSFAQYLRDQLAHWWSPNMHCLKGGFHSFPEAFFSNNVLDERTDIQLNKSVRKITYTYREDTPENDLVTVTCYPTKDDKITDYTAKAVLVTTPINILRQLTFTPTVQNDVTATKNLRKTLQAMEDIYTGPSTKIFLQTKRRFWQDAHYNINGGFSKTNLPIGQMHYVNPEDHPEATAEERNKGLILIYTWKNEAMLFGSMSEERVKQEVIEQIGEIHPEINEYGMVETCIVHAWFNQPSYQGAYGLLKTTQFDNISYLWEPTLGNVHFAGDILSFTTGWIQGAFESGLCSAYQIYKRYREREAKEMKVQKRF